MGGFLDFLNMLTNLLGGSGQDGDPSEMHGAQNKACNYRTAAVKADEAQHNQHEIARAK